MRLKAELVTRLGLAFGIGTVAMAVVMPAASAKSESKVSYSRDVLPILSDKCFKCHGPDASSRMAGMRLDTAQGAFADHGGHWPIVPGKPQDSQVVKRINDADDPMPPKSSGKSLTSSEVAILTKWIAAGAEYDRLWSFTPLPQKVVVPKVKGNWARNDIDRFVLAGIKKAGLTPSPQAPRERLLRRVTLDLTGLPPTEKEIVDFVSDTHTDAYDRVVARLLASPHFGERLAVDWLDAARYSDSYGYQSDLLMPTWPYRDWVVRAFNKNMSYDQFLIKQIAGDLLPHPTRDDILATAFNRLHRQSNEGGSIAEEFKTEYAVDRVSTFGTAVLGLTLGCARCHDHKFDPISQREFYQLYGYFNSIKEYGLLLSTEIVPTPSLLLPTPEQEVRYRALQTADQAAKNVLAASQISAGSRFSDWLSKAPHPAEIPGLMARIDLSQFEGGKYANQLANKSGAVSAERIGDVKPVAGPAGSGESLAKSALEFDGDNGLVIRGLPARERFEPFTWSFWVNDPGISKGPVVLLHRTGGTDVGFCGFDLLLEGGKLTARVMRSWPGNAVAVQTQASLQPGHWEHVAWSWDGSGEVSGLKLYVNGRSVATTVLNDKLWKKINAYGDLGPSGGEWSFAQRFREAGFKEGKIAAPAFASRALSPLEVAQLADGVSLTKALAGSAGAQTALKQYYTAALDPQVKAATESVLKAQTELTDYEEGIREISVMEEAKPRIPAYLLARGRYDAPRTAATRVDRAVPRALPALPQDGRNDRLTLAKWVTAPNHPLTARVAVNRLWQMVFGVGLVETSENFGVQGSRPSNQALLDFLARKFIDSGWNVKAMVRYLVTSATYRQDSTHTPKLMKVDPENHWLARGPSQRLSAEMIRDTALEAAGLLNEKVGGSPVNPYQPAGIWQENNTMSPGFVQSKGADLYRRSLYSTWKRTTPVPSMMLFDATSREACTVRRPSTNTPLQALVLLNDVQYVEAARALAQVVVRQEQSDDSRIRTAFIRLSGRAPSGREMAVLRSTLKEQRRLYEADPKSAQQLIAVGELKPDPQLKPSEVAAMTVTVQTVLNSDSVVWKR
jgi:mono/diheme cytochrome c family protein